MKTILAAVDFSPITASVLKEARALASALKSRLVLLYVVQPPILLNDYVAVDYATVVAEAGKKAQTSLEQLCKKSRLSAQPLVVKGYPKTAIIAQAKKAKADLIVMGSHGHGAFYDLVLGGTANGVLSSGICPVVIVPALQRRKRAGGRRR